jgi:hypothetical protein
MTESEPRVRRLEPVPNEEVVAAAVHSLTSYLNAERMQLCPSMNLTDMAEFSRRLQDVLAAWAEDFEIEINEAPHAAFAKRDRRNTKGRSLISNLMGVIREY